MTYQGPQLPEAEIGRSPPQYKPPVGPLGMVSGLLAVCLLIGGLAYFMAYGGPKVASNIPPSTVGQSEPRTMAPVIDPSKPVLQQHIPVPTPVPPEPRIDN
jgi:hypothetical protein